MLCYLQMAVIQALLCVIVILLWGDTLEHVGCGALTGHYVRVSYLCFGRRNVSLAKRQLAAEEVSCSLVAADQRWPLMISGCGVQDAGSACWGHPTEPRSADAVHWASARSSSSFDPILDHRFCCAPE